MDQTDQLATVQQPSSRKRRNRWDDEMTTTASGEQLECSNCNSVINNSQIIDDCKSGTSSSVPTPTDLKNSNEIGDDANKRARKSRWGSVPPAVTAPASVLPAPMMPSALSEEVLQQSMILQLQLQQINQKLLTVVADALRIEQDPNRSPSPPPKYDANGKRTNTREMRMREALTKERLEHIDKLIKLNPTYQPPLDFIRNKPFRRIFIPKQTDPLVNYIGLIIGPRGMTQKELESQTGCKISIRGKGSAKEGSKGRAAKNVDEDEDLHVHVQGDDEEKVALACKKIEDILRPLDETLNEHKQKQLKQLALINGTLRENEYCPVCGEKGHQQFDCPYRAKAFKAAGVKCSICGDLSHPTRDCPMRREGPANESMIESEYDNFIAELTGGGNSSSKVKKESSDTATVGSVIETENISNGNSAPPGGRVNKATGQTILAPIVDMFTKKPQTIIHVNTVLTGAAPPSVTTSVSSSTDVTSNSSVPVVSSIPPASAVPASVSASSNTSLWPAAATSIPSLPTPTMPPATAASYGAYYSYNAYSAYYGYDTASLMAMQSQPPMAMAMYPSPPLPPVAPPLPPAMYAPLPPPPIMGYMPPPPPPST